MEAGPQRQLLDNILADMDLVLAHYMRALVLLAVPLQFMRAVAAQLPPGGPLVVCAKGVEAHTNALPLEVLAAVQPGRPAAVLTGPNFAREVAAGLPAATVAAGRPAATSWAKFGPVSTAAERCG